MLASTKSLPGIIDVIEITEFEQFEYCKQKKKEKTLKVKHQTLATNAKMHGCRVEQTFRKRQAKKDTPHLGVKKDEHYVNLNVAI